MELAWRDSIESLPSEVLLDTLLRLPEKDITEFCRTSSRVHNLCGEPSFWGLRAAAQLNFPLQLLGPPSKENYLLLRSEIKNGSSTLLRSLLKEGKFAAAIKLAQTLPLLTAEKMGTNYSVSPVARLGGVLKDALNYGGPTVLDQILAIVTQPLVRLGMDVSWIAYELARLYVETLVLEGGDASATEVVKKYMYNTGNEPAAYVLRKASEVAIDYSEKIQDVIEQELRELVLRL